MLSPHASPVQQRAWTDCKFWEDMRSATPVVKLFPDWPGTLGGGPNQAHTTDLHFETDGLQCTLQGLTCRDHLCRNVLALGRQTAGRNVLVNP